MPEATNKNLDIGKLDKALAAETRTDDDLLWRAAHDSAFSLSGFPWFAQDGIYRRLPKHPAVTLRDPVDQLANCTTGGQVRFQTNSRRISVRAHLHNPPGMIHMPATAQNGIDIYIGTPGGGRQSFYAVTKCDIMKTEYETLLFEHADPALRTVTINFPLYQGVHELSVGLEPTAKVLPPEPYAQDGKVIIYGTSITQGGCAARPGMAYPNILSRMLNREVINLGFSGNGIGDPEVARLMTEIEQPLLYLLDYEANAHHLDKLQATLPTFITILRQANPTVPILVASIPRFDRERIQTSTIPIIEARRDFQRDTVEQFRAAGDEHIHFLDGADVLDDEYGECTVDGTHPTDLGFARMAEGFAPAIRALLV